MYVTPKIQINGGKEEKLQHVKGLDCNLPSFPPGYQHDLFSPSHKEGRIENCPALAHVVIFLPSRH